MPGEAAAQLRLQVRAHGLHVIDDVDLVVDLQRLHRDGGRYRVARIGVAVAEGADLVAFARQALEHPLVHHDGGDRQVGG